MTTITAAFLPVSVNQADLFDFDTITASFYFQILRKSLLGLKIYQTLKKNT